MNTSPSERMEGDYVGKSLVAAIWYAAGDSHFDDWKMWLIDFICVFLFCVALHFIWRGFRWFMREVVP